MEAVVGVPIGGTGGGVSYLIPAPIGDTGGRMEVEGIMEAVVGALEEVIAPKTNPEMYRAEYPQSVSARGDTQYESPHSPPAGY